MKKFLLIALAISSLSATSIAAHPTESDIDRDACTSIMVGKKASADGSVITSHTCDSKYRTWMQIAKPKTFKNDTIVSVFKGRMHTEYAESHDGMTESGRISQPKQTTYRFLDTAYPCMNEHQLAMGETTYSGLDTLVNPEGMLMIEELQRIAMERCRTAREAILLMGKLIKEYGYGDGGECLTIADPKEVWIFEVQGAGKGNKGGVWAAQRIPDDHIGVSANISRIGKIDFNDKKNFLYSDNVKSLAKKMGLWDGKSEFSFWKAYSKHNYMKEPKNYSVRELYIMQQLAPSAGFNSNMEELPVSVKPDKPVSVHEIARLLGSYYEGTDLNLSGRLKIKNKNKKAGDGTEVLDSVVSPVANPWMQPDEIAVYEALGDKNMKNIRTVSVPWCSYTTIIQCRDWLPDAIGGVVWMALDNPGQSPRFPIFAGTTDLPDILKVCGQHRMRDDSALWHYRKANKLATVRWGDARKTLEPARDHFLQKGVEELPFIESRYQQLLKEGKEKEAAELLTNYTRDFFGATIYRWDELANNYWQSRWKGF